METSRNVLSQLAETIDQRKRQPDGRSYTAQLLAAGGEKIGKKLVEEAFEAAVAGLESGAEGQAHLVREAADVLYHLMVLLASRDVTLAEVEAEVARRFGTSGLDEKAARSAGGNPT